MTDAPSFMYVCPECDKEVTHDHLLRAERLPAGTADDGTDDLIRLTYRHPCAEIPLCTAYPFALSALRRLFPDHQTVLMPWPRVVHVGTGTLTEVGATPVEKSAKERLLERTAWEMEGIDTISDFLNRMRGPRQPEELRKEDDE